MTMITTMMMMIEGRYLVSLWSAGNTHPCSAVVAAVLLIA